MKHLYALLWLMLPLLAEAAPLRGPGYSLQLPEGWETRQGVMGLALMARPPKATNAEGWGQDLLTVSIEPADKRRSCLDGYTLRKLQQLAYHASSFEKLEQEPLELGGRVATRLTLRYTEGPRELMAYVLILDAGSEFITATLTAPPARFELQRAAFRSTVESLRAASKRKAAR